VQEQESQLPLYRRIAQCIHEDIVQRSLAAHTKIASEVELARQFGVSHGTITKAVESLVREGIVYRQRPQGTFVAESVAVQVDIAEEMSLISEKNQAPTVSIHTPQSATFVGIVIPHLGTDFLEGIVLGVETMTRSYGYGLSFAYSEDDWDLERYHLEQFLRQGVAGILIYPAEPVVQMQGDRFVSSPQEKERIALLQQLQAHIPFVFLDRYLPEVAASHVVSDDFAAGYASTQHLVKLGHQRIGFVTTNYFLTSSAMRYAGYLQCLRDHHLPEDEHLILRKLLHAFPSHFSSLSLMEQCCAEDMQYLRTYLEHPLRPTAVVSMNDFIAIQLMHTADHLALRIPEDLALVCSGGSSRVGSLVRVPMTTIVQPVVEVGRQSTYILHDLISQRFTSPRQVKLPVSLLVRKSSGAPTDAIAQTLPYPVHKPQLVDR
jgi:GntR family transcriptional regulator of arabinose operon